MLEGNAYRAERAYRTVLNYDSESNTEGCISSLLCDLRHLCDESGYDFAELDGLGRRDYEAQRSEEARK